MKKLLFVVTVLMAGSAFGDIPPEPTNIKRLEYQGEAAKKLYDSLDVKAVRNDTRLGPSSVKVLRAEDGLFQIVCRQEAAESAENVCLVEVSLDGKEVPKLPPPRIRG